MQRFWEAAATVWSAGVIGLAVSPLHNVNLLTASLSDKVLHGIAFLLGSIVWAGTLETEAGRSRSVMLSVGICLGLGALIELLQTQTATRTAEAGDFLADAIGAGVGALLWVLFQRKASESASQTVG
ncbi:MAG: VanZ family protein [Calditrichaeota bacterium]|nr:VanZ family protein [Calditrichota bacterium]MCB9391373.1 VanZ family protein [Calditrichota bacterium]